ncbi:hypothetical protein IFM89_025765 [Coptis chinensis]|uniref:Gamma-tubulin complex component n=1 Tax=Coptis chinensis TaxID=261450 RepID=A0A835LT23_9MAGN|nr:hypothetical protein IFM89_025765 [Coptis chinensis]
MAAQPQHKPIATRAQITLANQFSRSSPVVTPCGGGGHAIAVVAGRVPYQDDWKKQAGRFLKMDPYLNLVVRVILQKQRLVDVIESQWNVLHAHVQDSHDFTELVGFHQEYLSALISQSFLDIGSVSRILDSIMKLCLQFCWNIECDSVNTTELEHITEEFNKKSNSLYTILRSSRLVGSQRAPFLRRFLLRLNFNSFFETTARGVLNVVRSRPTLPDLH